MIENELHITSSHQDESPGPLPPPARFDELKIAEAVPVEPLADLKRPARREKFVSLLRRFPRGEPLLAIIAIVVTLVLASAVVVAPHRTLTAPAVLPGDVSDAAIQTDDAVAPVVSIARPEPERIRSRHIVNLVKSDHSNPMPRKVDTIIYRR